MLEFLQENAASIFSMVLMTIGVLVFHHFVSKGHADSFDKKRVSRGMEPMTQDEKELSLQSLRNTGRYAISLMFFGYIVGLLLIHFF
jgi:hypothetical protein